MSAELFNRVRQVLLLLGVLGMVVQPRLAGQTFFPDFDLDPLVSSNSELNAALRGFGFAMGQQQLVRPQGSQRLRIGFSTASSFLIAAGSPANSRGLFPLFQGSFVITTNLLLTGQISALRTADDIIHYSAYGATLDLQPEAENSHWFTDISLALLKGPADFYLRTIDLRFRRDVHLPVPITLGFGANFYSGRLSAETAVGRRRQSGQSNYFLLGIKLGQYVFGVPGLQLRLNNQVMAAGFEIVKVLN